LSSENRRLLEVAVEAAREAVGVHHRRLGTVAAGAWTEKGIADYVTDVDLEAERRIVEHIRAAFPGHGILAEEAASRGAGDASSATHGEWLWIIDPLDGTTNYLHRYPMYAASIAVARDGELMAGVVASGASDEVWTAVRGEGARRNGDAIHVSETREMGRALIGTGFPFKVPAAIPGYLEQLGRVLPRSAGVRRAGAAAVDLCHVASGWLDGFWELSLAPWDVAAGALIVREAGGLVSRLDGESDVIGMSGSLLAGNATVHAALDEILKGDGP
jgi:myo-inositol-1(or 4)-monophosphatase